ncbi:unnamed protein product [Blepharisma stoltei]|uniref:Ferrochelatase n=1 Tax=Blepharisma stoltei TaxID=1481888 RepID=A0AAU9KAK4_9CILI|nr:unnamed protein product [Blepharisma stoltei]
MTVKTGILLMNLGGPTTLAEVEPFLVRMFSDKSFIPIPFNLGPKIARIRARTSVQKQYSAIGFSPLSKWTNIQGQQLVSILDKTLPESAPHKFYKCFRYSSPLTDEAISELKNDKVKQVIAFTQYPHYSCATTGNALREVLNHVSPDMELSTISRWGDHPAFINFWVETIKSHLASFANPEKVVLAFTAHSIPAKVAWSGDRYPIEISTSVNLISSYFGNESHLFWQSKVGFQQWLEPNTHKALLSLGEQGKKDVLIIPIAFTQDHLETLYELDKLYIEECNGKGMNVKRTPGPNDNPLFISALATIVKEHILHKKHSKIPRCAHCKHPEVCKSLDRFN